MSSTEGVRLNKYISSSEHCSRREADKLIEDNRVKINGQLPGLGTKVFHGDEVTVDGFQIYGSVETKSDRIYLVYNKPIGITCTTEKNVAGNIIDAIDHDHRIFPIGRLDKPSEGLILLTNDGDIVNKILRAENAHDKEYLVTVNKAISSDFAGKMSKGIPILDTITKPCKVSVHSKLTFKITLTEGLNRQIRRMCEYLGYEVTKLQRIRIMNIQLGRLKPGQWRNVNKDEMALLNKAISHSSGESSKRKKPTKQSTKHVARKTSHAPTQKPKKKSKPNQRGKSGSRNNPEKISGKGPRKPTSSSRRRR